MSVQPVFFHSGQYRIETDLYQGPLDSFLVGAMAAVMLWREWRRMRVEGKRR